ncbi:hypothetical protein [Cryobacterium sp. TMS1-13-1]|uniref:DUF7715 family protein n=1 Tax=Cryobacterium sp. TMS1-13-1 TaxID=1259220 RepID=UPI001A7E0B19|nr:hypothetical protein [Cryobacterium sp. TMS1-13-1]
MHVLVATDATQGARRSDFANCIKGELVWMLDVCPESRRNPDGQCPCGRSFRGLYSDEETTTALVTDLPNLTRSEYQRALYENHGDADSCPACRVRPFSKVVDELIRLGSLWPIGTVMERRVDLLQGRAPHRPWAKAE